ncbi:MAG TPA: low temperature requirement protein A [Acidimicrobiales bacterium]|nr:low temperature requirement protein A [Acidimicrobiales bacterium]
MRQRDASGAGAAACRSPSRCTTGTTRCATPRGSSCSSTWFSWRRWPTWATCCTTTTRSAARPRRSGCWCRSGRHSEVRSFLYGYGHVVVYAAVVAIGVGVEVAIERAAAGGEPPGLLGWGMVLLIGGFFVVGWGRVGWSSPDPAIRRVRPAKIAVAAVAVAACSVDIPVPLAASLIALAWVGLVVVEMRLGLMPGWPGMGLRAPSAAPLDAGADGQDVRAPATERLG